MFGGNDYRASEKEKIEMSSEIWKDIVGYEGLYQVSSLGRVRSLDRVCKQSGITKEYNDTYIKKGRVLNRKAQHTYNKKNSTKYYRYQIVLYDGSGRGKSYKVHRLVAQAFIPNPENKPFVNHIDCNPQNNNVENLEWVTPKENVAHMDRLGRRVSLTRRVKSIDIKTGEEKEYNSMEDAVNDTGLFKGHICGCCRGYYGRKTVGGRKWEYI